MKPFFAQLAASLRGFYPRSLHYYCPCDAAASIGNSYRIFYGYICPTTTYQCLRTSPQRKMRQFLALLAALSLTTLSHAQQSIAPVVNNLVSMELSSSNTLYTASIGETAITTLTAGNHTITQGFLQPEILPCIDLTFNYYPNPVKDIVTIEATGCEIEIESLQIYDFWGRHITTTRLTKDNELSMGDLAQGMYYIKVTLNNQLTYSITIVKTTN
jgi:hypothetical protein